MNNEQSNKSPEGVLPGIGRKTNKKRIIATTVFIAVTVGLIIIYAINYLKLSDIYDEAVALADKGSYQEAENLFQKIENQNFRDTASYITLCEAHKRSALCRNVGKRDWKYISRCSFR